MVKKKLLIGRYVIALCFSLISVGGEDLKQLRLKSYEEFLATLTQDPPLIKAQKVNRYFNQIVSAHDSDIWGKEDYWATPEEFIAVGRGDCEDYAVAKYKALRLSGVPPHDLRIMVVKVKQVKLFMHMVLAYRPQKDQSFLVLDNLSWKLLPLEERTDLELIMSLNENEVMDHNGKIFSLSQGAKMDPIAKKWEEMVSKISPSLSFHRR